MLFLALRLVAAHRRRPLFNRTRCRICTAKNPDFHDAEHPVPPPFYPYEVNVMKLVVSYM